MFSDYGSKVINRNNGEMFNSFYYSSIAWTVIEMKILGHINHLQIYYAKMSKLGYYYSKTSSSTNKPTKLV
jgi:hypothetical protein